MPKLIAIILAAILWGIPMQKASTTTTYTMHSAPISIAQFVSTK